MTRRSPKPGERKDNRGRPEARSLGGGRLENRGCRRFPRADRGRATNYRIPADRREGSPTAPGEPPSHAATTGRTDRVEPVPGRQDRSGVERGFAGPDAPRLLLGRRPAVRLGPVSSASLRAETIAVEAKARQRWRRRPRGSKPRAINVISTPRSSRTGIG